MHPAHSARMVGLRELKARASALLREVQSSGAEFVITVRGRPVARLEPFGAEHTPHPTDGMGGLRGALSELPRLSWEDLAEAARRWEPRPVADD